MPFILAMVELVAQQRRAFKGRRTSLPWVLLGAIGLGCQMLAGHAENTYFVLLVTALYAIWRLGRIALTQRSPGKGRSWREAAEPVVRPALWLTLLVVLGLALGAVQFAPLYDVVSTSFRGGEEAASLTQVLEWAYPPRRLIAFAIPNFFGNPAHHSFFDLFSWEHTPAPQRDNGRYIYWGIKNYVEGGAYLGLLPLFLAVIAIVRWVRSYVSRIVPALTPSRDAASAGESRAGHHTIPFFILLSAFSLGCIFGTPLYALVYALPLLKQSHSPFRWVFPLTLAVAILAGLGADAVQRHSKRVQNSGSDAPHSPSPVRNLFLLGTSPSTVSFLGSVAVWGGLATLGGLALSRVFFAQVEPLVEQIFASLAGAPSAFPNHRAFYSYEFKWIAIFALLLSGTGIVLRVSHCPIRLGRRPLWEYAAVGFIVVDLIVFATGFYPALDPALLGYTPPAVDFLKNDQSVWRYAAFTPPGTTKTMRPNVGMFYDLQGVAGYDSLFSSQYRDYMALIEPQDETLYNLIAAFRDYSSLDSPLTDHLNVKYVITEAEIDSPKYEQVYQDEAVRIYENLGAMP